MSTIGTIYARYSSDSQREESIDGQLRECIAYAKANGITLIDPYIDRALSARTDNRPAFQKMINDSAKGLFDVIIVWKLDRFARDRFDSAHYKRILKKNGVKVVSATENISDAPDGILMESVLEGMAEYYSAELAVKVRRGLTENALKAKCNGGTRPFALLVSKDQQFYPDPVLSPIVLECFRMYDSGILMKSIVQYMKSKGVRTQKGNEPNINFVARMLRNRKYAGDYVYDDEIEENAFTAIVPRDMFNRVQERLDKNTKSSARYKAPERYLLTLKLFCGKCGSLMAGESGTSHTGAVHHYYKCGGNKYHRGCKKKSVKKAHIEKIVVEYTKRLIMDDETISCLAEMVLALQEKEDDKLPYFNQQLAEVNRSIDNLLNAIQQGILTSSTKTRLDELEMRKSEIEVAIIQAEIAAPKLTKEDVTEWIKQFRELETSDFDQCQLFIDSFVNAVYVYDDRLMLTINAREGTHTVIFDEVQSLFSPDSSPGDIGSLLLSDIKNPSPFPIGEALGFILCL